GPRQVYSQKLIDAVDVDNKLVDEMEKHFWSILQERLDEVKQHAIKSKYQIPERWWQELRASVPEDFEQSPDTSIDEQQLRHLVEKTLSVPENFRPLRKVTKLLNDKKKL